jgi:biopolymer transport protein ExbD
MRRNKIFEDEKYSFNFMPLLDAIFLLSIFFILTVTLQKEEKILPINLPVAESPTLSKLESAIIVEVDQFGNYFYQNQMVTEKQLEQAMAEVRSQYQKDVILIRTAEGTDVQKILRITDLARRLGIEKISIAVREQE